MNDAEGMNITLLAFGPLAESLGWKRHQLTLQSPSKIEDVLGILSIVEWSERGLVFAINGLQQEISAELNDGDELAFLPPVSGG
jgi:molybdopterin synthase sulfur carrier subunit